MRFNNCPTCGGSGTLPFVPLGMNCVERLAAPVPCPTCQDSDGKPTGRICVLSAGEIEWIADRAGAISLNEYGMDYGDVGTVALKERTHRQMQATADAMGRAIDRGAKITVVVPPKEGGGK